VRLHLIQQSRIRLTCGCLILLGLFSLAFTSCKSPHQVERRTDPALEPGWPKGNNFFQQASYTSLQAQVPTVAGAEMVNDDELCMQCHEAYAKTFADNVHRAGKCESCHGPASRHLETQGREPGLIFSFKQGNPVVLAEACLKCHEENACSPGAQWRTSRHAHCGVTCVSCHRGHYNVAPGTPAVSTPQASAPLPEPRTTPVSLQRSLSAEGIGYANASDAPPKSMPSLRGTSHNLGAVAPGTCYRCHGDMQSYQQIAGPHQICGPNGFNCTTCHDPHGKIREGTRQDLCLQCHVGAPTMAWHSSTHSLNGVACTDCHNPHPRQNVPQIVNISHETITRPMRLQMSVQQPEACYKCHQKMYGMNALPSHHPIKEGKMVCSDCHDAHGQETDNLREATINLLCYKCHAEKQGPFAFEHAPVRENCTICHEPHGTVVNNLLRQPTTFLCIRCHPGHYSGTRHPSSSSNFLGTDVDTSLRRSFYTDCSQCHQQIHGTDRISQRSDPYFTR
jgi:DmsE family decaheme c-type cytochrome